MRIRDLTVLLATFLGTIAAASVIVTGVVLFDNRALQQEMRDLRRDWSAQTADRLQLQQERAEAEGTASTQGERLKQLEAELAGLRSDLATNGLSATARAYRAPVFMGQTYLGQGWVALRDLATNSRTGPGRYEPVVVLDPAVRAGLAGGKSNVIERPIPTPTTVNYNYPYPYYGYGWWPAYWAYATNSGHDRPSEVPPSSPPTVQPMPASQSTVTTASFSPPGRPVVLPTSRAPNFKPIRPAPPLSPDRSSAFVQARPRSSAGQ